MLPAKCEKAEMPDVLLGVLHSNHEKYALFGSFS
jgi:hypothetical protein